MEHSTFQIFCGSDALGGKEEEDVVRTPFEPDPTFSISILDGLVEQVLKVAEVEEE